jgi:hypothetical protein
MSLLSPIVLVLSLGVPSHAESTNKPRNTTTHFPKINPCPTTPTARPVPTDLSVVTRAQLVFDLCRAYYKYNNRESILELELRLRTIAEEARLVTVCIKPKMGIGDTETDPAFLTRHNFGCGPYHLPIDPPKPQPKTRKTSPTTMCSEFMGATRPKYSKKGAHGPITAAQFSYDLCYVANVVQDDPANAATGTLPKTIIPLVQNLELEQFEAPPACPGFTRRPSQSDADYAVERNYGCGSYSIAIRHRS